jgi:hypothetical protein
MRPVADALRSDPAAVLSGCQPGPAALEDRDQIDGSLSEELIKDTIEDF